MKARTSQAEQPSSQPHLSRVVRIINLGLQPGFQWEGEEIEAEYKIDFTFEILDENMRDGRPFWVSKEVNNKDSDKGNLFQYVTAAGATCSSVEQALTKPVSVTPRLKKSGWATVDSVSGLPMSLANAVPELVNEPIFFDFTEDEPDMDTWYKLDERTQEKIMKALDFNEFPIAAKLAVEAI